MSFWLPSTKTSFAFLTMPQYSRSFMIFALMSRSLSGLSLSKCQWILCSPYTSNPNFIFTEWFLFIYDVTSVANWSAAGRSAKVLIFAVRMKRYMGVLLEIEREETTTPAPLGSMHVFTISLLPWARHQY